MVKYKADLNLTISEGETVLHFATQCTSKSIPLLLESKCDPNMKNLEGETPFHIFCNYQVFVDEIIKAFLKHKADPNILNQNGASALLLSCQSNNKELIALFLIYGADINIKYYQVKNFFFYFKFFSYFFILFFFFKFFFFFFFLIF